MDNFKLILGDFYLYLEKERGFSIHTLRAYKNDLNRFASFLSNKSITGFRDVDRNTIRDFLGFEFDAQLSSKTVARRLASIKSLFKYLMRSEQIKNNPAFHVKSPMIPRSLPNFIDQKVINTLMESPNVSTPIGMRDRAILELFYSTGIRLSELIALNIGSVDSVRQLIKVNGKFRKGDNVLIMDENHNNLARGLSSFSSEEINKIKGLQSNQILDVLGYSSKSEIVHKDDMVKL